MSNRHSRRINRKRNIVKALTWQSKFLWISTTAGLIFIVICLVNGQGFHKNKSLAGKIVNTDILRKSQPFDIVYGQDTAPVTIVEYASLTCGHCKNFHKNVVVPLKQSNFYDGKARLLYRHYPLNKHAFDAAVLLSCIPQKKAKQFLGKLFEKQKDWVSAVSPQEYLKKHFKNAGMSDVDIDTCLANEERKETILLGQKKAQKELNIRSTPTVFINEKLYTGPAHIEGLRKTIFSELEVSKKIKKGDN